MKVLLVANYLPDGQQSMQRFAGMLERGLSSRSCEVRVVRPEPVLGSDGWEGGTLSKWLGYLDKFVLFPRRLRAASQWADVVHICDHANAMYYHAVSGTPVIVTCHDLMAVRTAVGELSVWNMSWSGVLLQKVILRALESAPHVVCISDATRHHFERLIDCTHKRITRIYNGLNYPYHPMERRKARTHLRALGVPTDRRFYLHVGGNQWYKNRLGVLRIYEALRVLAEESAHLVMVGKPYTGAMRTFIEEKSLAGRVHECVDVTNEELRGLYSEAEALIYPSLREGFGWPIVEAQACGCPVFTTDRPPMTEIGGGAAKYIDPERPDEAARTICRNLSRLDRLRQAGLQNARRFGTAEMVDAYVEEYRCAVSGRSEPTVSLTSATS